MTTATGDELRLPLSHWNSTLVEFGSVVGLQEGFYIFLGVENFAVKTVIWDDAPVAVVLRGASAYTKQLREHCVGDEPSAVEQWVVLVFQPLAHISDVVGLCRQAHYARIGGGDCFFHCPAPSSLTISRAMSPPLNCESLPRCENPILPRSFMERSLRSDMWR